MATRRKRTDAPTPDTLTDPVDWARHYWREQALEGDEHRFIAMTSLLRYQRIMVDAVEAQLRTYKLNLTDYLLLMTLQLSESGTRLISNLARSLMVHATTATLAIDRLENKRLLSRTAHPTDRRATCITITAAGRKLVHKATIGLGEIGFGLGAVNETDLKQLTDLVTELRSATGDTGKSL